MSNRRVESLGVSRDAATRGRRPSQHSSERKAKRPRGSAFVGFNFALADVRVRRRALASSVAASTLRTPASPSARRSRASRRTPTDEQPTSASSDGSIAKESPHDAPGTAKVGPCRSCAVKAERTRRSPAAREEGALSETARPLSCWLHASNPRRTTTSARAFALKLNSGKTFAAGTEHGMQGVNSNNPLQTPTN
eukprot:6171831-Pleurochrysis_carterae.AAC.4